MVESSQTKVSQLQLASANNTKVKHCISKRPNLVPPSYPLVIDEDIGALDVSVQEVLGVAVMQRLHHLQTEAANVLVGEFHHP